MRLNNQEPNISPSSLNFSAALRYLRGSFSFLDFLDSLIASRSDLIDSLFFFILSYSFSRFDFCFFARSSFNPIRFFSKRSSISFCSNSLSLSFLIFSSERGVGFLLSSAVLRLSNLIKLATLLFEASILLIRS